MGSLRDSHLCRICAEESLMPSVLFGGDSKELRDKIMFFLPLSILESSDMPRVICQKCNQDLDSLVEFFQTLNQGQIKLLDLLSERKRKRPSWNGKKQSLFDKKYPSGVERKPTHHKKDDEDFSSAYEDPTMLMEHSNGKQEVSFGDTSMRFECLEPSCHLRFQNAQQIEQHLKVENHSTMTLVVPSEVVANQNSLEDPLAVSSSHSNLPELKDLSMPPATASDESLFQSPPPPFYNRNLEELVAEDTPPPYAAANNPPAPCSSDVVCKVCDMRFECKESLQVHEDCHASEKSFSCDKCGKQFRQKSSLMQHMKLHGDSRVFKCSFCSKSFSRKGNLSEHTRTHTGEKPYSCRFCECRFKTSSQHRLHEKTHSGEKPWKCELCSRAFLHQSTWKYHMMRHRGDKAHACLLCKKAFTEPWGLKKHMRVHDGERPYSCEACGKTFADLSNYSKHAARAHPQKKETGNLICEAIKSAYILSNGEGKPLEDEGNVNEVIYITYDGAS